MTTQVRCPKCNGFGNFILNIETNETSCKDCGVVFNKLTTKQRLEQLGWEIIYKEKYKVTEFYYPKSDVCISTQGINTLSLHDGWINITELQLILDYIKEQEL